MKRIALTTLMVAYTFFGYSQEESPKEDNEEQTTFKKFTDNLSGSFESNAQWYLNDKETGRFDEDEHVRANSYLRLDYNFLENFTVGIQGESYAPEPLLNYSPIYDKRIGLAQFYANYKTKKLDITAGYFYEQFGSGLILRFWEDRALGINNSLRGGRIKYAPTDFLELTGLYGQQRKGFSVTDSDIFGFNAEFSISSLLNSEKINNLNLGLSYVGKKEDYTSPNPGNPYESNVPEMINSFSGRIDFALNKFYTSAEYIYKSDDVRLNNTLPNITTFAENKKFDGNAILWTAGYSQKGLGISYTFRRLEGMRFFSEREAANATNNPTQQLTINYVPGLTKQHDYTLTNIYVYQAQPGISIENYESPRMKAGEIGNQIDFFYKFKRGSTLGGKYGTKVSLNYSYWANLGTTVNDPDGVPFFASDNLTYESDFLNFKNKIFTDLNIEVRKKWSPKLSSQFTYINLYYNKDFLESKADGSEVRAWIGVAESTYKFGKGKSLRLELQHLSTNDDARNWAGGTIEFFLNSKFGVYLNDSYNYEDSKITENTKIHLFNLGGSYTFGYSRGAFRAALNYGRQRGGLLCVGGVCRPVSKNTGLTLNLNASF